MEKEVRAIAERTYQRVLRNPDNEDLKEQIKDTILAWGYRDIWIDVFKEDENFVKEIKELV